MPGNYVRRRRGNRRRPELDQLEGRMLLSAAEPEFARLEGAREAGAAETIAIRVREEDFAFAPGRRVLLRVVADGEGGRLDPGATRLESPSAGGARTILRRADIAGSTSSLTLAMVRAGRLILRPTAQGKTRGAYTLRISLAGDVNGDYKVDRHDLRLIRLSLGTAAGAGGVPLGADVDGDGRINGLDLALAGLNFSASTKVRPLEATADIAAPDDPDGDGRVDDPKVRLVGRAAPGALVRLDRGADGRFEATTRADARGHYRFTLTLTQGANPVAIRVSDPFGQVTTVSRTFTLGPQAPTVTASFDFRQGAQGWQAGFSDLPAGANGSYELDSGIRDLPAGIGSGGTGYMLQGHNRSDDLFMFLKRQLGPVDGVRANQSYEVRFKITFASNAPTKGVGIGGAPGESVFLKAGATAIEPRAVRDSRGFLRMNVDKGNQALGGSDASLVGNIANGEPPVQEGEQPYVSLTRSRTHTATVRADDQGRLWLLVGTDSGFEGLTRIYFQRIEVLLTPVDG